MKQPSEFLRSWTALLTISIAVTYVDARVDFIGIVTVCRSRRNTRMLLSLSIRGMGAKSPKARILMAVLVFFYPLVAICIGIPIVAKAHLEYSSHCRSDIPSALILAVALIVWHYNRA